MRPTVVRLMGCPKAALACLATSASDKRLSGKWVWDTASQAIALTTASSRGGKPGFTPPSRFVRQSKMAVGPAPSPEANGVGVQLHLSTGLGVGDEGLVVQEEHQSGSLPQLV